MATRSRIGIENPDGTVTSIYCHWDGYPENNGLTLKNHYQTRKKVEELIALGNISSLAESIEKPEGHCWENAMDGYTVAYHRDRGAEFNQRKDASVNRFLKSDLEEYGYLYTQTGEWICIGGHSRQKISLDNL